MYKGYIIDDFDDIEESVTNGTIDLSEDKEHVYSVNEEFNFGLDKFILKASVNKDLLLDGTKIINEYFPEIKADIFISHSHKDVEKAKQFANLIHWKTGLKSFIDSEVWRHADSLLKKIDKYCKCTDGLYDYNKRNTSTGYVHMMLNTALLTMIDKCECLFFLSTPNSFETANEIRNSTFSPWIYSELSMANSIEKKIPERLKTINKALIESSENFSNDAQEDIKIVLKPRIENLIGCNFSTVENWLENCDYSKKESNLDGLYESTKYFE